MTKYSLNKSQKKPQLFSEKAEAMPAAIISTIVTSMILVGIASVISIVVQNRTDETSELNLSAVASNIDTSLRSDISQASFITANVKLTQPTDRLLNASNMSPNGIILHIPSSTDDCKVIKWKIDGTTATRDLTVYSATSTKNSVVTCDETSSVLAQRTKDFGNSVLLKSPFKFKNHVGRELTFSLGDTSLAKVNDKLDKELTEQGVDKLSDVELQKLTRFVSNDSVLSFSDPTACSMNAETNTSTNDSGQTIESCPPAESETVQEAWNSTTIASVSVQFDLTDDSGHMQHNDVEQSTSLPLL